MKQIQKSILEYANKNNCFALCLTIAPIMAVCYPVYLILPKIESLGIIWWAVNSVASILYIAYLIGTILCFAQNKMIPLVVAYSCMTLKQLFAFSYGGILNQIVYLFFYGAITVACVINIKKIEAQDTSAVSNRFCPQCGRMLKSGSKFCPTCGMHIEE